MVDKNKDKPKVALLPKSVGPKTLTVGLQALVLWPDIVNMVNLHGAGATSAQKQEAAMILLQHAGGVAVAAVGANNPAYAQSFAAVNAGVVATKNADGTMPEVTPIAAGTP